MARAYILCGITILEEMNRCGLTFKTQESYCLNFLLFLKEISQTSQNSVMLILLITVTYGTFF